MTVNISYNRRVKPKVTENLTVTAEVTEALMATAKLDNRRCLELGLDG